MPSKTVIRELSVNLKAEEVTELAHELANREIAFLDLETQHKAIKMDWRDRIKMAKGGIKASAEKIRDKAIRRMVECTEEYTVSSGMIVLRRNDTGEQIEFRKASEDEVKAYDEELQGGLFNSEGEDDAAAG